jgi:hypothetical protein
LAGCPYPFVGECPDPLSAGGQYPLAGGPYPLAGGPYPLDVAGP